LSSFGSFSEVLHCSLLSSHVFLHRILEGMRHRNHLLLLGRFSNFTVFATVVVAHIVPEVVHPTSLAHHAHLLAVKVSILVRLSASLITSKPIISSVIIAIIATLPFSEVSLAWLVSSSLIMGLISAITTTVASVVSISVKVTTAFFVVISRTFSVIIASSFSVVVVAFLRVVSLCV